MILSDMDMRDAFFDSILDAAREDPNVVFLTADMGAFSLEAYRRDLPKQFVNVGIAEQNLIDVASGLARAGKRVFAYAIIPFVTLRCMEQIKVDLSLMNLPVTLVGVGAGFTYGSDGPTHHAAEDVAVMRALPGLTLWNPSDAAVTRASAQAVLTHSGPSYVRLERGKLPVLYDAEPDMASGVGVLRRGRDATLVATGYMTHRALQAAEALAVEGLDVGVADLFRIKPIDGPALMNALGETERVITLEENFLTGGLGSAVLEALSDAGRLLSVKRLALPDSHCHEHGDRDWILERLGLDEVGIANSVRAWLKD